MGAPPPNRQPTPHAREGVCPLHTTISPRKQCMLSMFNAPRLNRGAPMSHELVPKLPRSFPPVVASFLNASPSKDPFCLPLACELARKAQRKLADGLTDKIPHAAWRLAWVLGSRPTTVQRVPRQTNTFPAWYNDGTSSSVRVETTRLPRSLSRSPRLLGAYSNAPPLENRFSVEYTLYFSSNLQALFIFHSKATSAVRTRSPVTVFSENFSD